ncbi:GNAT family N-acetyltransferase [Kitasatospora sp. NPDC127059]|uniref:GNAT family N-acetyltransferase n=1 Tax=unclassified Kitasatospora TaxID=2633591 RepID=UPI00365FCACB
MDDRNVTLRQMTPAEYQSATEIREAETIQELAKLMPEELARERARQGTARFLPDGPDTPGHHLVVAEDESGRTVGSAWIGPDPRAESGSSTAARLYDLRVLPEHRRSGYGVSAMSMSKTVRG